MKILSLALAFLMLVSVFAVAFAIAEDNAESDDVSADLEVNDANELADTAVETNKSVQGYKHIGFSSVTAGQGYAISGDFGFLADVLWINQKFVKISKEEIKEIREKARNGSLKEAKDDLIAAENDSVITRSFGRLHLGLGKRHSNYKLVKADVSNESASFDVYSLGSKNETGDKVGTLSLTSKKYSDMTLWIGKLVLDSGDKVGTYDITIASKTKVARGLGNEVVKAMNEKAGEGQGKKKGFLERLKFWRN